MGKVTVQGERVVVSGFGLLQAAERAEQNGRNPQTGKAISIPAHSVARFRAGKKLRALVNNR